MARTHRNFYVFCLEFQVFVMIEILIILKIKIKEDLLYNGLVGLVLKMRWRVRDAMQGDICFI